MNKLAIQSIEEWQKTRPSPSPSPTIIPDVVGSQAESFTIGERFIQAVVILISIVVLLFILYLLLKIIFPKTARYLGYLIWEFKKGREGKSV